MNKLFNQKSISFLYRSGQIKSKLLSMWTDILEAIKGTEKDFTTTKLSKAIFLLSVPMVLEMIMESIFAIADIFFVSKLGKDAVAIVGVTEALLTILYALCAGLSTATTAIISRRIGEKNSDGAAVASVQAILIGLGVSFVVSFIGIYYSGHILKIMGASPSMIESGTIFTQIMLGGNFVIMLLFIINAIFRSSGDAAYSMRVLFLANLINIILDPCLIYGLGPFPALGIKGAAIATTIGRGIGVVLQLRLLFGQKGRVKIRKEHIQVNLGMIKQLLKLSIGGVSQALIATSSWVALVRIIAVFGAEAIAGYTIAIRIIIFSLLPSWGMSNAASTLVGQNLGAKAYKRAEKAVWFTGLANMIFLGIIGIILIIFSEFFIGLFIDNPGVLINGKYCLRIISCGFIAYGLGMVMVQAFNGAGDTWTPTIINFFCFWILEIPLAYILAITLEMGQTGVFYAIIIAETAMTVTAMLVFRRGKWKNKIV